MNDTKGPFKYFLADFNANRGQPPFLAIVGLIFSGGKKRIPLTLTTLRSASEERMYLSERSGKRKKKIKIVYTTMSHFLPPCL